MNNTLQHLQPKYVDALHSYLCSRHEEALQTAYELGRQAVTDGFGILDIVKIHHRATEAARNRSYGGGSAEAVETFFMEALSPFEVHHRGFREANARLRELSSKLIHAQEEERGRISRELHDEVGAALTAIGINLQLLKQKAAKNGQNLDAAVTEIQSLLELTSGNVHKFSYQLRPVMLEDLGLVVALKYYLRTFARRTGIKIRSHLDRCADQLPQEPRTVLYRIVQESLTNVFKYAHASELRVSLRRVAGNLRLTVMDNGRGFHLDKLGATPKDKNGLGLMGMDERLRLVGGGFSVVSEPGRGTTVQATVPFKPADKQPDSTPPTRKHS